MLPDLRLELSYRSGRHDLVGDFYVPCLSEAREYRRAVGYFTSSGLSRAAKGLAHLITKGGKMKLVASPNLTEDDIASIGDGYANRDAVIVRCVERTFADVLDSLTRDRLGALQWLVSSGALEVRLAIRVDATGRVTTGIYHEKFGLVIDASNNCVAFTGSSNETAGGLVENFESIHVFRSWSDSERVSSLVADFDRLWSNETPGLHVLPFTDATAALLRPYKMSSPPRADPEEPTPLPGLSPPTTLVLRSHQSNAVAAWFANNGRGIMAMATGSGKTITALAVARDLAARVNGSLAVVIVSPYLVLLDQWEAELERWGCSPVRCAEDKSTWWSAANAAAGLLRAKQSQLAVFVTTNKTFRDAPFQQLVAALPKQTLLVVDEVHNMGAPKLRESLPSRIPYRLGLTATPDRKGDAVGSAAIREYFGDVIASFTLEDALLAQPPVLSPYDYWPTPIELTTEEGERYLELSVRIGRLMATQGENDDVSEMLLSLLVRRARLVAAASNKLPALLNLMRPYARQGQILVYCGDARFEAGDDGPSADDDEASDDPVRQVEAIAGALRDQLGMRVATYTSRTSTSERRHRLEEFALSRIQALVAIRCLDEGVDLPDVRTAFILASSTNPRQFIQRRGRVLRRAEGKLKAVIFDFIVAPPAHASGGPAEELAPLRRLVEREFERVAEFARTALNAERARAALLPLLVRLQLEHL